MKKLKLIKVPELKRDKEIFQDANDTLSSFPFAKQERREPTANEKVKRKIK